MMVATGGESAAAPASRALEPTVARIFGGAVEHSAKASLLPGAVNATDTAQSVLDRGGTGAQATRAALGSATSDVLMNAMPIGVEGGPLARILSGGTAGAAGAKVASQVRNATLPEDMQQQPTAGDLGVGAVQGAALGALLGPRASSQPLRDVRAPGRETAGSVLDRAAQRAAAATTPDSPAAAADEAPSGPAPAPAHPNDVLQIASKRLDELDARDDLSPAETEERDFLRDNAKDPKQLADAMGVTLGSQVEPAVRESATPEMSDESTVNPIPRDASPEQKLAAIHELTEENKPLVDDFLKSLDTDLGTTSKSNVKADDSILAKASRPSILAEKPYHGIEHVRDTFRFMTVINSVDDLPKIAQRFADRGWQVVKVDTAKMLNPKTWGWRFAALDMRMPNGQLVEYYMPLREMEAAKGPNHKIFEKWRNEDFESLSQERKAEMAADIATSRARYDAAFQAALSRAGTDDAALRASLNSFEASLGSSTGLRSESSATEKPFAPHSPLSRTEPNPSGASTQTSLRSGEAETTKPGAFIAATSGEIVPQARARITPRAEGRRAEAFTAGNEAIPFRYALVDAGDLVSSNHPDGRVNPAYPQELQPRDRTSTESRTQVQQIAGKLQPERLGESPDIVNGAPLVGPDGIVESGNGRVMALATAPAERRNAYRRWLRANADRFGIDPAAVDGVRSPVLVRVREGDLPMDERARIGQEGNRGTQQAMNPSEIARSDARVIDDDVMALFHPSEDGDVLAATNQPFLREFARRIGGMEAAGLSADGRWTKQMADRVNAAVFWRAYGDERLLHAFAADADPDMKGVLNALGTGAREFALANSAGAKKAGLDAGALFADAMSLIRDARERGMSVRALLDQGDMFSSGHDPAVTRMASWLSDNARSYRRLGESLLEMGRALRAELESRGSDDMFGRTDRGLREIADDTVRSHEDRSRPPTQSGLFSAGGKPRPSDAGSDRAGEPHGLGRAAAETVPNRVIDEGASRDGPAEAKLEGAGQTESGRSKPVAEREAGAGEAAAGSSGRTRRKLPRGDEGAARPDEALTSGARDGAGWQSVESLREALGRSSIGTALRALERTGVLRIIDDPAQVFAGRWDGQHAVLNAAHIPDGEALGVALHELGIHREREAGLRGMLGDDVFNAIVRYLGDLEKTTAPVLREAREVIAEARARIEAADTPAHQRDEELVAYAAEGAARRLESGSPSGALRDLVDRLARKLRAWLATGPLGQALAKRGFALKVTPDDLVHIAMAAVRRQAREAERADATIEAAGADPHYSKPVALTAGQTDALGKIGVTGQRESPRELFRRLTADAGKRLTQGIVDQFAPLKDLDQTAYMQARLSKGTDGALEAAFLHGLPKLTDGALDIDVDGQGLRGILADLDGEHDIFLAWVAGNRAEKLKGDGRENLFAAAEIAALKSLNQGTMANGRLRGIAYAKAQEAFKRYQKAVLDIAEEAGLIDGASRAAWESEFYVPFYRIAEEDAAAFVPGKVGSGLVRQQAFKKLKGGTTALNDLLGNTLANWSNLLTGSMRNMAATKALAAAEQLGIAERIGAAESGSVWISEKGKQVHYRIEDPMVLDALTALNYTGIKGGAMDAMRWFRHALTTGVTISPTFRIRNLLRDTLSTLAVSDHAGHNPLRNIVDGWRGTAHGSATDLKLLAGGGKVRFGSLNDGQQARNAKRLISEGIKDGQILNTPEKVKNALSEAWDWYKETGDRSESINRAAVYQNAIKAGKNHLEASYEARDLLDFTMGGKWASVRFLTGVVPFLNARIQGIYKLGKAARGNPLRFAAVAGTVAIASALNYLLQKDDKDYKALPDWARDTYWCVKLGGKMLYIPKPFEIGAMGSIVERMTELAVSGGDYQTKDFARTLAAIMSDQLSMNPVPQALRPAMEAAFNYDLFQGRPIDSMGDERLPARDRVGPTTSAGAVAVGRALGISPKRVEHLARGYFGWLGTQALNASDWALRDAMDMPSNPRRDLTDVGNVFVIGDFLKDARSSSDKYVTRFYAMQDQIDSTYAAHSLAKKTGNQAREEELGASPDLELRPLYRNANKQLTKINQRIKAIGLDAEMSAREKRVELDELYAERARIARETDEEARSTP
jgi:hypothetical protein